MTAAEDTRAEEEGLCCRAPGTRRASRRWRSDDSASKPFRTSLWHGGRIKHLGASRRRRRRRWPSRASSVRGRATPALAQVLRR